MSEKAKIPEELIECTAVDICVFCKYFDIEEICGQGHKPPCDLARHTIVGFIVPRTLCAFLNGDLDEVLGVVGRLDQEPQTRPYAHGVEESLKGWILNRFKEGARTFIALDPGGQTKEGSNEMAG